MTVINQTGNTLTGATGSGNFVGANTPTLITPVLGVSTATSINFGGGALSSYLPVTSWTPSFTFGTPGDLSVAYALQEGYYIRIGDGVFLFMNISFTPTFTTASGNATFTGLPFAAHTVTAGAGFLGTVVNGSSVTYPAGNTSISSRVQPGTTTIILNGSGSVTASGNLTTTSMVTGASVSIRTTVFYLI